MGRPGKLGAFEVSRRDGGPLLRPQSSPTVWGAKDHRREHSSNTRTKKNELLSFACVSDQRWFCGRRCVDGISRGSPPGLGHGATWETRGLRGFQARRRTVPQAAVVPHSVGSKGPPPGAQSKHKTKRKAAHGLDPRSCLVVHFTDSLP